MLANLAKGPLWVKVPDLVEALTGHFAAHHNQLARSILHRWIWSSPHWPSSMT